jgi:hypothetical protein
MPLVEPAVDNPVLDARDVARRAEPKVLSLRLIHAFPGVRRPQPLILSHERVAFVEEGGELGVINARKAEAVITVRSVGTQPPQLFDGFGREGSSHR